MTPANIAGMAAVKGLDVIAVTDHNSCKNCPAVLAAAEEYGVYNTEDAICGMVQNLLINATSISFEGLWELVKSFGGVMFPAHVDKTANSLIANLGFIPPDSKFVTAEVKDLTKLHKVRKENPYLEKCRIISNSDAHYLEDIHEPKLTLQVREKSVKGVLEALAGGI